MSKFRFVAGSLVLIGVMACADTLVVQDFNDPDRERALGRPADVEAFISNTYAQVQNATLGGSNDALQTQLQVMGMENTSALANFAMGPRGSIPRTPISNTRNSTGDAGNYRDFLVLHRAARMATIGISRLDVLTLGSAAADARARSFARFVQGVAFGNLALAYDSASIVSETDDPQAIVALSSYPDVMAAALVQLDSAITIARANPGAFPIPNTWISGVSLDTTLFFRFIRSYKARFRASVARTPAERAAADWASIIADANAGITADFTIAMNPTAGWDVIWPVQAYATGPANWHQMSQFWMGMADSSGAYSAWLNTQPSLREPFIVVTADQRFPRGLSCIAPCPLAVRTSQIADSLRPGFRTFTGFPYVRNRQPGEDQPGNPLQISMYDFYRSRSFFTSGRIAPYPVMTRAEIRLYAAEGYIRTGNFAAATARIDSSRVTNGVLPSVAALTDTISALPGGVSCVPRIPDPAAAFKASKCGTLWDAMKWEYRMETAYAGYGMWYFSSRGWGDLPEGTALYWPVPYQEMDTRRQEFYSAGGPGQTGGAPRGNYGLYAGGVY